ncbi:CAAX protease [Bifidobacterium sp. UTCIF-37]|uniref:CPBP family intramembrane glutamic endopeptidase n=1 Tax=unclassified Bifidobacterium TaxID=2608897 RepID=UPI001126E63C|nr:MULTISPECIES: CPBP family intramembrane glutamic endopeptidase [unclassified Bifidobacterium]TPF86901.1 CAAX protease [Bifidobacterium sp. UTCIF-37]TPF90673.1 CAAX protease [Bifidobacterium sp. UTCIF-38]
MNTITNEPQRPALKPLQSQSVLTAQPLQPQQPVSVSASESPESPEQRKWWRGWRRRVINRAMGVTLIYQMILIILGSAALAFLAFTSSSRDEYFRGQGVASLAVVLVAVGFLTIVRRRDILTREFWLGGAHTDTYGEPNQLGHISQYGGARMTPRWALVFLALAFGVQGVRMAITWGLSQVGVDLVSPALESISEASVTVSMWLYAGLIGPICEEVLFRGVLMKELKPLGKNFAIVTSALIFALFHQDLVQSTYAFAMGLVLGFIAMEYSLIWAIALHVFNNAVLGGLSAGITHYFGETGDAAFMWAIIAIGLIGLIVVFAKYGKGLTEYQRANRSVKGTYSGWASWTFIVFVAITLASAIFSYIGAVMG